MSIGTYEAASLTAADTYTTAITATGNPQDNRDGSFSITGTWAGTISVLESLDDGTTWAELGSFTANTSAIDTTKIVLTRGAQYKIGFLAGAYTSGTAVVSLRV